MLTGESIPVEKSVGDSPIGGSMNYNGAMEVEVTHVGGDTTLARIVKMMEDAQGRKSADIEAGGPCGRGFVPAVMGIAIAAGSFMACCRWKDMAFVLTIFVAVLVICLPLRTRTRDTDGHHGWEPASGPATVY